MPCLCALGIMNPDPLYPCYPRDCRWDYGPRTDEENQCVLWQLRKSAPMDLIPELAGTSEGHCPQQWIKMGTEQSKGFLDSTPDLEEGD